MPAWMNSDCSFSDLLTAPCDQQSLPERRCLRVPEPPVPPRVPDVPQSDVKSDSEDFIFDSPFFVTVVASLAEEGVEYLGRCARVGTRLVAAGPLVLLCWQTRWAAGEVTVSEAEDADDSGD